LKAAIWHAKRDIRIEDVPAPARPGPDEALVEVALCGICGTDLHEYTDGPQFLPHEGGGAAAPAILGHEFCGTVVEVGAEVSRARPGDRVAVHPAVVDQSCRFCRVGLVQLCDRAVWLGLGAPGGGLSKLVLVKNYQLFPLPDSLTFEQGAVVEPASVTMQAISRGGVQPGDVVLITGGGPIGQLAAMNARAAGAKEVFVSEVVPLRRDVAARTANPTRVLDPTRDPVPEVLREATGGAGADVAVECSGNERALMDALAATRKDGTVVQLAIFTRPISFHPADHLTLHAKRLIGSLGYGWQDYERVIELMAAGRLPAERIVTATLGLQDVVTRGIEDLIRPDTQHVKILVRPAD